MLKTLQDNLHKRALRAAAERDFKTLRNLRNFATSNGDLPAQTLSTLSALIGNALVIFYSGSTVRKTYSNTDARLWYDEVSSLLPSPVYAQVSLITLAAEEVNVDISVKRVGDPFKGTLADMPTIFQLLLSVH